MEGIFGVTIFVNRPCVNFVNYIIYFEVLFYQSLGFHSMATVQPRGRSCTKRDFAGGGRVEGWKYLTLFHLADHSSSPSWASCNGTFPNDYNRRETERENMEGNVAIFFVAIRMCD